MRWNKDIILGAGIAGLSTGYHLSGDYAIYEKESKVGGLCRSVTIDGFIFDYAPHILYTIDPYASRLIQELLIGNLNIRKREAWIYHKIFDSYTRFPFQAHLNGLPVSIVSECLNDLFIALKSNGKTQPKNYEEWMYWRFGKGITEHLMIPYANKIWTVSPKKMNYEWIHRRVPEPNFKLILDGALSDTGKRVGFNNDFWYPIKGGIEALPFSFLNKVNNIHLNTEATRIFPEKKQVEFNDKRRVTYDRLISTLALPQVINLIKDAPLNVKEAASQLEHNSILCVNLGIDRENISDYHWLYFYESDFVFHRLSFPMNLSPLTTPKGKSSVSCEISYSKYRQIDKESIIDRTIEDLIKAKILKQDDRILVSDVLDIKCAYVIYTLSHRKNVDLIHSYLRGKDIYPCGRFGEWEYFNMDHSIMSGKRCADALNSLSENNTPKMKINKTLSNQDDHEPKISVVIVNWNGLQDTVECLESLKKIDYSNYEIIVVDNASTDGSQEAIKKRFPEVILITNKVNIGAVGGNNVGIKYALKHGTDYILLLNNDTIVDPQILKNFIEAENIYPDAGIFAGKIYYYSEPNKICYAGTRWDEEKARFLLMGCGEMDGTGKYDRVKEVDYACSCVLFVRKAVIERIGLFEDRFFYTYDEADWCYRARKFGFKSLYIPNAKVWHKIAVSFGRAHSPLYTYFSTRNRLFWAQRNLAFFQKWHIYILLAKELFREFFPCLIKLRHFSLIKRLYWDASGIARSYKKPRFKAKLFGLRDFVFRHFGDCPVVVKELNKKLR